MMHETISTAAIKTGQDALYYCIWIWNLWFWYLQWLLCMEM